MKKIMQKANLPYVWDINGEDYWIMDKIVPAQLSNESDVKKDVSCNVG